MIRHGAQSDYSKYVDKQNEKINKYNKKNPANKKDLIEKVDKLTQPDPPLLAFDENGNIYELKTKKDVCDYYKCKGQEPNPEWGCGKQ
jgi:hypothetical protein